MFPNYDGYYFNQQAYDLASGTYQGYHNIYMNQIIDNRLATNSIYDVAAYNFNFNRYPSVGNQSLYESMFNNSILAVNREISRQNGTGCFDENGNYKQGWSDYWKLADKLSGNTTIRPNATVNGSNPDTKTEEEKKYKEKFMALAKFVQNFAEYSELSNAHKKSLKDAINNEEKSWKEKFAKLNAAYKAVKKDYNDKGIDIMSKYLSENTKLGINGDNGNEAKSFLNQLRGIGYEYSNGINENWITDSIDGTDLFSAITKISKENPNVTSTMPVIGALRSGQADILDVISSYNSNKKDATTTSEKRIITHFATYYNKLEKQSDKDTAKELLATIVNALINKANNVKSGLDTASTEKIDKAIAKVRTEYGNTKETVSTNLSVAFDELYLLTRFAALEKLQNEVVNNYGSIDADVFNHDIFGDETIEDLTNEGFENTSINNAKVTLANEHEVVVTNDEDDLVEEIVDNTPAVVGDTDLDKGSIETQINNLIGQDIVAPLTNVKYSITENNETKDYAVYKLKNGEPAKLYVVKDGKFFELKNAQLDGDNIVAIDETVDITLVEKKASDIDTANKEEIKKIEAEKAEQEKLEKERKELKEKNKNVLGELVQEGILKEESGSSNIYRETTENGRVIRINPTTSEIEVYNNTTEKWETLDNVDDVKEYFTKANNNAPLTDTEITEAKKVGAEIENHIHRITLDSDWNALLNKADGYITKQVNSKNILYVLKQFEDDSYFGLDSFFEAVSDEYGADKEKKEAFDLMIGYLKEYLENALATNSLSAENRKFVEELITILDVSTIDMDKDAAGIDNQVRKLFEIFNIQ